MSKIKEALFFNGCGHALSTNGILHKITKLA